MKNLWNDQDAEAFISNPLQLRVYTSRLLGQEPDLVLHGGGNTSVKARATDLLGEEHEVLYVKGSGWDLQTIEAPGFAPVKLDALKRMAELPSMTDSDMVNAQRAAMLDPNAPNPSVEAVLHALIPHAFVDHTHADAVVTLSNTPDGEQLLRELLGERVLLVPYVMPGFILAKKIQEMTRDLDWSKYDGMVLLQHGVFTFADDARSSYTNMIELVSKAEEYLRGKGAWELRQRSARSVDLQELAGLRKAVSTATGSACIVQLDQSDTSAGFTDTENLAEIASRGPLTPDHVIRTKRIPLLVGEDISASLDDFVHRYGMYFERNTSAGLQMLNPGPKWAVWPGVGTLSIGTSVKEAGIIGDIAAHTIGAIQRAEKLGGWKALSEADIFDMEYWELEQAKLKKGGSTKPLQGKIALVTGAASGIGLACAQELAAQGAVVVGMDIDQQVEQALSAIGQTGTVCDANDDSALQELVNSTVARFGGIDILVSNAGTFPPSCRIEDMDAQLWDRSLRINLSSHERILQYCTPYLRLGIDPAVIFIASKNVPAPGPGASAYSVAKAGLTQLARIAALELAEYGVRVNTLHPDAVFDTAIWTDEVLSARAAHYGLTVQEYKTKNLLHREIRSADVAALASAMAGPLFSCTTGAQLPIDGGNDRVI